MHFENKEDLQKCNFPPNYPGFDHQRRNLAGKDRNQKEILYTNPLGAIPGIASRQFLKKTSIERETTILDGGYSILNVSKFEFRNISNLTYTIKRHEGTARD